MVIPGGVIRFCIGLLCCFGSMATQGQTFADSLQAFRNDYIKEHLEDKRSPIKEAQVKRLRFFAPDAGYRVWAKFIPTMDGPTFSIPTHSGKLRPYKEYGILRFTVHDTEMVLHVYQSQELITNPKYKDHLFVPFNDLTNYVTTYAGGRYIDLKTGDIRNGRLLLDFNKCYNPYCAYAEGFSCPIPPDENKLKMAIRAGEMNYAEQ